LAHLLKVRAELRLYAARVVDVPNARSQGLFVLVHELPENGGLEVTAINFGATPIQETVAVASVALNSHVRDVLDPKARPWKIATPGQLPVSLAPYSGVALQITR
jgi:hypothetical protein